jgi:CTP:molybdopterin cytidylyltransferase MocA
MTARSFRGRLLKGRLSKRRLLKGPTLRRPTLQKPSVAVVILAAGAGERFGGDKLTAELHGNILAQRAIDAACSSRAVACFLVVGARADSLLAMIDPRRCAIVTNTKWRDGIASSIRAGVAATASYDACIFTLGDQPNVTREDVNALIHAIESHPTAIVALRAGVVWGAPVAFPRRDYAALAKLKGDAGAKTYAQSQRKRLRFVRAADARAFDDIDTKADLHRANQARALATDAPRRRRAHRTS